jgi:SagB-type dehydrogenase family enzyme
MVDAREYHERTKHSPESVRDDDFSLDWTTLPRPFKTYRDLPREAAGSVRKPVAPALATVAEHAADPLAGTAQTDRDPVDGTTLASVAYYALGIKGASPHPAPDVDGEAYYRMASCTGNLHHVDGYLVSGDLDGLPAGVYHYDPQRPAFERLRSGDHRGALAAAAGDRAEAGRDSGVADASATLVLTSEWWRNAWKYRERTYRHAFWDGGCVLAHVLATAHALDLQARTVAGFHDHAVAGLLGLDPATEAPIALVPLGNGDAAPVGGPPVDPIAPDTEPHPRHERTHDLPFEAWEASALPDGAAAADWRARLAEALPVGTVEGCDGRDGGDGETVPLDPVDHETASSRPLAAAMRRRRSERDYADDPVSARRFATVLDRGLRGVPLAGNEGPHLALNDVYVAVRAVDGVPAGAYHYRPGSPDGPALERVGDVDADAVEFAAMGQSAAGEAAATVALSTDVDAVVDALGDRGYRLAQLEAGVALGRLYLATYAHRDLGGQGLTFFDDELAALFAPRSDGQTPTTLFVFGHPA